MHRKSHAVLDLSSRYLKAQKIERLLGLHEGSRPIQLLDIGTGCGGIAHYFAVFSKVPCAVTSIDVVDQRLVHEGYQFLLVSDTNLPFPKATFDVVISNHVIEHVGKTDEQENHLQEIRRVLACDGVSYLATPNRWALLEPHFKVPFLSWLPEAKRESYLKLTKAGERYDCEPLSACALERLLKKTGFCFRRLSGPAVQETIRLETHKKTLSSALGRVPTRFWDALHPLMPTLVYLLKSKT